MADPFQVALSAADSARAEAEACCSSASCGHHHHHHYQCGGHHHHDGEEDAAAEAEAILQEEHPCAVKERDSARRHARTRALRRRFDVVAHRIRAYHAGRTAGGEAGQGKQEERAGEEGGYGQGEDYPALAALREAEEQIRDDDEDGDNVDDEDDDDDDDNEDEQWLRELEDTAPVSALEAARREEMARQIRTREFAQLLGFGVVHAAPGGGDDAAVDAIEQGWPVCVHAYNADSVPCAHLDMLLERMAAEEGLGTAFRRCDALKATRIRQLAQTTSTGDGTNGLALALGQGQGQSQGGTVTGVTKAYGHCPPFLAVFRDGHFVAAEVGLRRFCDENRAYASEVRDFLDKTHVLVRSLDENESFHLLMKEFARCADGAGGQEDDEEGDLGDERFDCGVTGCNKSFAHEHVGSGASRLVT